MKTTTTTDGQPTVTWVLEAKFKDLTDEEIKDFIYPQFVFEDGGIGMPLDEFLATVRAILRKAQEK